MATSETINITTEQAIDMFDTLSRTNPARQVKPLDRKNYIIYDHRYLYDSFNLRIGDVEIMVPPAFIHVSSESFSQNIQTLRQENSQKQKTGYHKRIIQIDLVFNGMDEINGYKVPSPIHEDGGGRLVSYYYVDGLRTLLAQFKCTPFLPIENELINNSYGIYTVALQSIIISTIDGFQNALSAHLTLQEVNMMPYIEMPDIMFNETIDWDLFRYYTQSFMTEDHVYKKLQSLPSNKDHTAFKLSILNEECLQGIVDTKSGTTKEETVLRKVTNPDNYTCMINSEEEAVSISSFQCSYANILTSIQMADCPSPTLQYLGGLDTQFGITFETYDKEVVSKIEQCQISNDLMVRNNPKIRGSIGFVKLEADFVTFCGSLFVTIESVETNTVEGMPGLYSVRLLCVSYDIAQSRREELNGFLPFDGYESNVNDLEVESNIELTRILGTNTTQTISQSYNGLMKKIYQDNYAEAKLRESMEVYPDLRLPTYNEVDLAVTRINSFRKNNKLDTLSYTKYPRQPINTLIGNKETFSFPEEFFNGYIGNGLNKVRTSMDTSRSIYNGYVDPDFYVFYPNTYASIYKEEKEQHNQEVSSSGKSDVNLYREPPKATPKNVNVQNKALASYGNGEDTDSNVVKFIEILKTKIGCHYKFLAEGDEEDGFGPVFCNYGLLTYALKYMGIIPGDNNILSHYDLNAMTDTFKPIPVSEVSKGDVVTNGQECAICTGHDLHGNISYIYVSNDNGVQEADSALFQPTDAYRILPLQPEYKGQGTKMSNPYGSVENIYPDENGEIHVKDPTELEIADRYTSNNPYADDNNKALQNIELPSSSPDNDQPYTHISGNPNTDAAIWDFFKNKGLSDEAVAGIMGNLYAESGLTPNNVQGSYLKNNQNQYNNDYTRKVDSGEISKREFVHGGPGGGGYGLAQWTFWSRKEKLYDYAQTNNKSIGDLELQLNFMWNELQQYPGLVDGLKNCSTVKEASDLILTQYEKPQNYNTNSVKNKRESFSKDIYTKFNGTVPDSSPDDSTTTVPLSPLSSEGTISNADAIKLKEKERRVKGEIADELAEETKPIELDQADISGLTLPQVKDDGSNYTDGSVTINERRTMTINEYNALAIIVATECEGERLDSKMAMAQILYDRATDPKKSFGGLTVITKNHIDFHGERTPSSDEIEQAKSCIYNVFVNGMRYRKNYRLLRHTSFNNANYDNIARGYKYEKICSVGLHNIWGLKQESAKIGYTIQGNGVSESSSNDYTEDKEISITTVNADVSNFGKPIYIKPKYFDTHNSIVGKEWANLNSNINRFNTSFVDEVQYSGKGRLVRAFPTFLLCILDDQAQWYDGRKLWTNYYTYKPVIDINYHTANDMPMETATITVTNTYHNLDRSSAALINYSIKNDKSYGNINRWLYKNFGMVAGGLKITNRLIQMHSILFNHTRVREGARVHLRMGYGSDPMSLAPIINGTISGITLGDQISIIITSDGHELIQSVTSDKEKDINNGALGTGIGANQEASDIISEILVKRQSFINHLWLFGNGKKWFEGSKYNIEHYGLYLNSGDQHIFQGGIDVGIYEQYDLLMNIYKASTSDGIFGLHSFRHYNYIHYSTGLLSDGLVGLVESTFDRDGESNIVFNKYNMTPWDVFQLCAQTSPEFIVKSEMYQFDSRLFFGLPFELTKYRYDIVDGNVYQECKSSTQMHYIDSLNNIIENQVSVTSRPSFTNAKVMYTLGSTPKSTAIIHSDDTIDNSKQSTRIVDSNVVQDYIGWDAAYEFLGISKQGRETARKIGISTLLYGWEQQYQGQLLCLGNPQTRPHDYIMLNDFFTNLNGLATVREVVHSFNTQTGFTTSITPGVIGFCPEQNTGNIIMMMNFLILYDSFTQLSQSRKLIQDNCQRYHAWLSAINDAQKAIEETNRANAILNVVGGGITLGRNVLIGMEAVSIFKFVRVAKSAESLKQVYNAVKTVASAEKLVGRLSFLVPKIKNIQAIIRTISAINKIGAMGKNATTGVMAAAGAAAPATLGVSLAVGLIISIIINTVFDTLLEWITNKNVCVLLPLWYEAEPFISNVKDGEKILLIPSSATATDENTGEDGFETDEDEIALNSN